jgi:hypothetical protein
LSARESSGSGNGTLQYRVQALERRLEKLESPGPIDRRLDRLEAFEPGVMRRELLDMREDLVGLVSDVGSLRKLFMGFIITFSITSITIVVLILTQLAHKP